VAITVVLPSAASRCDQTRSPCSSTCWLALLALARTRLYSLSLACLPALARTRLNSLTFLELFRTRSPGAAKLFRFPCLPWCYCSNKSICYVATKFCKKNIVIDVGDMTTKRNWKKCSLMAEFNFRFQFLHVSVFRDLHAWHGAKFQRNRTIHN